MVECKVPMLWELNVVDCFNYKISDVPSVQYWCDVRSSSWWSICWWTSNRESCWCVFCLLYFLWKLAWVENSNDLCISPINSFSLWFIYMLIDVKSDNHGIHIVDLAARLPPCNPWRPICSRGMWWWFRHRGCISYVNFSIDFYSIKKYHQMLWCQWLWI